MRRIWVLFAIGVVALLAGLIAAWQHSPIEAPPVTGAIEPPFELPIDLEATAEGDLPAVEVTLTDFDGDGATPTTERQRVVLPGATDPDSCEVTIQVRTRTAGVEVAVPFVEVALMAESADGTRIAHVALADGDGKAHFEVVGGRHAARATCALGGEVEVPLRQAVTTVTLRIEARVLVQGRVVDATGRGIADADLVWLPFADPTAEPPRLWRAGRSAADGNFRLPVRNAGRIGAMHRLYAPSAMFFVPAEERRANPPIVTVRLTLPSRPLQLSGIVLSSTGQPIVGAELEFRAAAAPPAGAELAMPPQRVRSREGGVFVVTNLARGTIEYFARARGHGRKRGSVHLIEGLANVEVRLPEACTVEGVVQTKSGAPVAGAIVTAGAPPAFDSAVAVTCEDGTFALTDLAPGSTAMHARANLSSGRVEARGTVDLDPAQVAIWTAIVGQGRSGPCLNGFVVDRAQQPLAGWQIVVRSGGTGQQTRTEEDGSFAVDLNQAGRCDVRLFAPERPRSHFADELRRGVDPTAGPLRMEVDPLARRGTLRGRVLTPTQEGVPATIECWHHERAEGARFLADGDGVFRIADVPPGTVDLTFSHPGHCRVRRPSIGVLAADQVELGNVELGNAGMLYGEILGPDGRPPEACDLFVIHKEEQFVADYSGGTYRFAAVPPGAHTLHVQGKGLAAATFPVTIATGVERQQDIELRAGVSRTLRVVVPPGAGGFVRLAVRPSGGTMQWFASGRAVAAGTGAAAELAFTASLAPGTYEAVAWNGAGLDARATVLFTAADSSEVRLELRTR